MKTFTGATIAVVDGHDFVRNEMAEMLSSMGFKVTIKAANGKDFLLQLASVPVIPNLCLLDNHTPVMNGAQTASCVKTLWPDIKILAWSMDKNEMPGMLYNGADACILKGGDPLILKNKLLELYAMTTAVSTL